MVLYGYAREITVILMDFMRNRKFRHYWTLTGILLCCCSLISAQPNTSVEIPKQEKYQNRVLASEKTGNKKFTIPKRLYNNTVSHYNYYFNANSKLRDIISNAKLQHKENYRELLPFYNYSLNETSKGQIDSIIYKCTAGILLHDLRSDWVDQFYLLMGNAYLHRKDFDSATYVFNYINYAFANKEDGYDIPIGSNVSSKGGSFSVSTDEKRNFWKKISSPAPARNESFLMQARNFIEQEKLDDAESLLQILAADRFFPERLKTQWHEQYAYLLYKDKKYDSAAFHLTKALPNATNNQEMARWEYLAAQLYSLANKDSMAIVWFEKAIKQTTDPFLDVFARLNIAALSADGKKDAVNFHLSQLLQMAKREKYQAFRDLIYYAAAELALSQKNYLMASNYLNKSIEFNEKNAEQKARSFFLLSEANYLQKKYIEASSAMDSVNAQLLTEKETAKANSIKGPLQKIAKGFITVNREDSLQKIAALPSAEREAYLTSLLKKLRKERGIKESEAEQGSSFGGNLNSGADLFGTAGATGFYFANNSLKTKGLSDFKAKWGNRPNIDNWRRQSAVDRNFSVAAIDTDEKNNKSANTAPAVLSFTSLEDSLPLTPEKLLQSNNAITESLLNNANGFQYELNDAAASIETYELLAKRFPESAVLEDIWFQLNNAYKKTNQYEKADSVKQLLQSFYPKGKNNQILLNKGKEQTDPAIGLYQDIYNQFISGDFEKALLKKQNADKQLGSSYWTPQLLYIESVYFLKNQQDSIAKIKLNTLASMFKEHPLAERAKTFLDVINRRKEIETYLSQLSVERPVEIPDKKIDLNSTKAEDLPLTVKAPVKVTVPVSAPTMPGNIKAAPIEKALAPETYQFNASDSQFVAIALYKVDPVFVSEARNAWNRFNQERYYNQKLPINVIRVNDSEQILIMGPFANAAEASTYTDRNRPQASSRVTPWLDSSKFSFAIISRENLNLLLKKGETGTYWQMLRNLFPDKY